MMNLFNPALTSPSFGSFAIPSVGPNFNGQAPATAPSLLAPSMGSLPSINAAAWLGQPTATTAPASTFSLPTTAGAEGLSALLAQSHNLGSLLGGISTAPSTTDFTSPTTNPYGFMNTPAMQLANQAAAANPTQGLNVGNNPSTSFSTMSGGSGINVSLAKPALSGQTLSIVADIIQEMNSKPSTLVQGASLLQEDINNVALVLGDENTGLGASGVRKNASLFYWNGQIYNMMQDQATQNIAITANLLRKQKNGSTGGTAAASQGSSSGGILGNVLGGVLGGSGGSSGGLLGSVLGGSGGSSGGLLGSVLGGSGGSSGIGGMIPGLFGK